MGIFTPASVILTAESPSATFTYTPDVNGPRTISTTNDGGLTDPAPLTYTVFGGTLSDGDPVDTWEDSSGNGHDATGTGSTRPIYKTNQVNSKPVVRFTSAAFSILNLTPYVPPQNFTWFLVMKRTGSNLISVSGSNSGAQGLFISGSTWYCQNNDGYMGATDTMGTTAFHVVTGRLTTGLSAVFYFDGAVISSAGTPNATTTQFSCIGALSGLSLHSDGDIAEIIEYNIDISNTNRENIEKYLATKYGLSVPAGTAVQPDTVTGLIGWWKADSLG